jgi:hypothetical protein
VSRASGILRLAPRQVKAVSLFAACLLFIGSLVPSWHAAQKAAAQASVLAGLQTVSQDAVIGVPYCHNADSGAPGQKGSDGTPLKSKSCPLCLALQLFSCGVTQPGLTILPNARLAAATFIPHRTELKAGRETAEQGRPRAPPRA